MSFIKEYKDYAKLYEEEVFAYLVDTFLQLWFKPKEPLEKFKQWFSRRINKYDISWEALEIVLDNYYDYWSEQKKEIKNFKTSFFNNPMLRKYLKEEYKDHVTTYNIKTYNG